MTLPASFGARIVGTDSAGRTAIIETPAYTELSGRLRTVTNAPATIRDFDGARLLHTRQYNNNWQLGIFTIATGANDPMVPEAKSDSNQAFLTPTGAIFRTPGDAVTNEVREWRNGTLTPGGINAISELTVQGQWATYLDYTGFYQSFVRRDLSTGNDTTIETQAAGGGTDVAPNGHAVYLRRQDSPGGSDYDLYRYDGVSSTLLDGDDNLKTAARTDGGDVLYWKRPWNVSSPGAWYIHNGTSSFPISASMAAVS